jgi:putative membrane protein
MSYVGYHFTTPETVYGDLNHDGVLDSAEKIACGSMRITYLTILLTHIFLAAISFPFILFTFIRAYTGQYQRHRKLARIVFPIWFYVALSGPVVYLLIKPYYA